MRPVNRHDLIRDERGQTIVLFGVLLPLFVFLIAAVFDVGNWWTHRRHLQTKVDAAAFAGGGVWSFPCGSDSDTNANGTGILDQARKYFGSHITAAGATYTSPYNPQVTGTAGDRMHVVMNGTNWWDDDEGSNPADGSDPATLTAGSVCKAEYLDVKGTDANTDPLFGILPFNADIKRKARIQIEQVEGLTGLLPIAVRVPKPQSAAAIWYNETPGPNQGDILAVRYFCEEASIAGVPAGLGAWTTYDAGNPDCSWTGYTSSWAQFSAPAQTGVVVGVSFQKACGQPGAGSLCFEDQGFTNVDQLCNQGGGIVQCFYATGNPPSQTIQSGLQFIRGYDGSANAGQGPPVVKSVWLDTPGANCGAYFSAPGSASCSMALHANIDLGNCIRAPGSTCWDDPGPPTGETRTSANTEVRWKIAYGTGNNDDICGTWNAATCDMSPSWTGSITVPAANARYSIALRVRLRNTHVNGFPQCEKPTYSANCEWYYTATGRSGMGVEPTNAEIFNNPLQRTFMGNINRSGSVKFLRLTTDTNCDLSPDFVDSEAASVTGGNQHCFFMDMGLQGGLAKDQDEPPIALNLGDTSQRSLLDCDPNFSNLKDEVVNGCQSPVYAHNKFDTSPLCPASNQFFSTPKAAPFDTDYPPWRCVLTQPTSAGNQLISGFNERLFGDPNNPTCPTEDTTWPVTTPPTPAPWTKGRNYWHRANNQIDEYNFAWDRDTATTTDDLKNRLRDDDPRLVTLFFTPYNSFTGNGNEVYPIAGFGNFYITGYGRINGGGLVTDDPCSDGNGSGLVGAGNLPPPDLDYSSNTTYVWGHFVKEVVPNPNATPSGNPCVAQGSFEPCVPVLVE